jgi:3-oxoacyl-[acyl-carrier protein] reductase
MHAGDKLSVYPDLAGKVVVVTGGSGGVGAATCRLFAANGARVAVNGRDQAKIDAVVDGIRAGGGEAVGVAADCTDLAAVERLRQQVEQALGPAEVVAAFVGGGQARPGPVAEVGEQDWHSTVDGSLTATFLTLKGFLPGMIQRRRAHPRIRPGRMTWTSFRHPQRHDCYALGLAEPGGWKLMPR